MTKKQKAIAVLLFMILVVPQLYLLVFHIRNAKSVQPIRGPSGGPFVTLPDNIVQNRIDIWHLDINDAGILTIDMNLTLDDGFYYVKAEVPVKGDRLKFKDYKRILEQEVKADGAN